MQFLKLMLPSRRRMGSEMTMKKPGEVAALSRDEWMKLMYSIAQKGFADPVNQDLVTLNLREIEYIMQRAFAAGAAAEREACAELAESEICDCCWEGESIVAANHIAAAIRARPKVETVTLRKALFRWSDDGQTMEYATECNTKYVENEGFFVCWLGDPVTYEVKK